MDSRSRPAGTRWRQLLESALQGSAPGFGSAAIEELLPAIRTEPDPLARAEGLMQAHRQLMQTSDQALDDLRMARAVFAANGRTHDEIRAVFMQAQVLRTLGYAQQACSVIRHAFSALPLSVTERASLAYQGVHALTQVFRYDEADELAQNHICPALEGNKGAAPRFIWWISLGYLRTQQFARAAGHTSVLTLDLPPDAPVDAPLAQRRLEQAQQCLSGARLRAEPGLDQYILRGFELTVLGCGAELAKAEALHQQLTRELVDAAPQLHAGVSLNHGLLLHANGQLEQAYRHLSFAAELSRQHAMEGPLHMAAYSLARLAQELGRHAAAIRHYEDFLRLHTRQLRLMESWFTAESELALYGRVPAKVRLDEAKLQIAKPPYLRRALALLAAATADPPSIQSLASSVGVTPRTLEKAMKRYQGTTPKAYVRELRMRAAFEKIQSTDSPLAAIAGGLGYDNATSFSRDFRRVFGCSPSEVRNQKPANPGRAPAP